MELKQFLHIIKAAKAVTECDRFLVLGSQAILGHYLGADDEFEFWKSRELDIAPLPFDQQIADLIDGCIGEMSMFDQTFRCYAHGCSEETPVFPDGWLDRAVSHEIDGCTVLVPSFEDLAISKYVANRDKDRAFLEKMWAERLLDEDKMLSLLEDVPYEKPECAGTDPGILSERIRSDADAANRCPAP